MLNCCLFLVMMFLNEIDSLFGFFLTVTDEAGYVGTVASLKEYMLIIK